jgi:hypothetical protein
MNNQTNHSDGFEPVILDIIEIKDQINKIIKDTETKVLINLLLTNLQNLNDKKIKACEILLEDNEYYYELKEMCYCLAYGTKYITYKCIL